MVTYAALFPGQGAQYQQMALDLHSSSAAVRQLFHIASEATGKALLHLLTHGTDDQLRQTENTQLVVTLANRAAAVRLLELGVELPVQAGFSLGELSAYATAGILDDTTLFRLVAERGNIMARAAQEAKRQVGELGMVAVIGLGFSQVERLFVSMGVEQLYCANDNGPGQVVVSGVARQLESVVEELKAHGARKIIPLKVSGPFHTPFMDAALPDFARFLDGCVFTDPTVQVYSSVTGEQVLSGQHARELCARQLSCPVRWTAAMQSVSAALDRKGLGGVLEVGPGRVLGGLWRSGDFHPACQAAGTEVEIQQLLSNDRLEWGDGDGK